MTVMKLMLKAGKRAELAAIGHIAVPRVKCRTLQIDEMWTYVHKKQGRLEPGDDPEEYGEQWIYVAIDPMTKLVPYIHVGKHDAKTTTHFLEILRRIVKGRPQITTDQWHLYPDAVELAFGSTCSYSQRGPGRRIVWNNPNPDWITSYAVERFNLTLRMSLRRLTRKCNGF